MEEKTNWYEKIIMRLKIVEEKANWYEKIIMRFTAIFIGIILFPCNAIVYMIFNSKLSLKGYVVLFKRRWNYDWK